MFKKNKLKMKFILKIVTVPISKSIKFVLHFIFKYSAKNLNSGSHITRYYMNNHLSIVLKKISKFNSGNKILSISGSRDICDLLNVKNPRITEVNFPEYNMLKLPFEDDEFDWVASEQVLEHIEGNPQQAIDESYRILKSGGIAIHTTCFINTIHNEPKDFWRFTPEALQFLCKKFSKVIDVGGWGNPYVWFLVWLRLRFIPIPHAKWHPLNKIATLNYKNWPIVTWIVVQK